MAKKNPQIVLKRGGGTDTYGLYIDYVVYSKVPMTSGDRLVRQERYFLADNLLCKYVRQSGNKRAAWRAFPLPNHDDARELLLRNIARYKDNPVYDVEMLHTPLLVELASTDIDAIKKKEPPYARFDGTRVVEKATGKINDLTWSPT